LLSVFHWFTLAFAQTSTQPVSTLPHLARFGGTVKELNGNPFTGMVGVTFALYSDKPKEHKAGL
jgi:hypothetical protein